MDKIQKNESLRRRRVPAFVTSNACTLCRNARSKCDGEQPCARCAHKGGLLCEYMPSTRIRKEDMRLEINELRKYRQLSEHILELLRSGEQSDFIIQQLRREVQLEDISASLPSNSRWTDSFGSTSPYVKSHGITAWNDNIIQEETQNLVDWSKNETFKYASRWTTLTIDDAYVKHLVLLYFCWEYPIFASISKNYFLEDFGTGNRRYCSSLLVNAILAIGCRFSNHTEGEGGTEDNKSAGSQFFAESERLLMMKQGEFSLTTVQAMGLMSIWQASCGGHKKAFYYSRQSIKMAVEMGLHEQVDEKEMTEADCEVRLTTIWGAFALDQAWSHTRGCLPQVSLAGIRVRGPRIIETEELSEWRPYSNDRMPPETSMPQPSNARSVYAGVCDLSTIIHTSLYALNIGVRQVKSHHVLEEYTRYLAWYDCLPITLRLGQNSTPSVFFAHMYYHFNLILMFYPFWKLRLLHSEISPVGVCTDAADAISALLCSYKRLHSLRRTPCFLPYIVLASGIIHLAAGNQFNDKTTTSTRTVQEISNLQDMIPVHSFASCGLQLLLRLGQDLDPRVTCEQMNFPAEDSQGLCTPSMASMIFSRTDVEYSTNITEMPDFPARGTALKERLRRNGFELIE